MKIYEVSNGWGDTVVFTNYTPLSVTGHKTPVPEVGDYLLSEMESGKEGVFVFDNVERMADPPDQFFASVSWLGYVEDFNNPDYCWL